MSQNDDHYVYRVVWSEDDQEYVGLCAEFPSLSWLAESQDDAWQGIRKLVAEIVQDMQTNEEPLPVPFADKNYSGNFQVRIPPEAHRNLAIQAAETGISLNRLVSFKLSR
jgi:predicted HicB family RNase H-like nuclease